MNARRLVPLFICSLVPWTIGNGLVPLLPVYASRLGADSQTAGNYMAFSYLAIALGAVSAGFISDISGSRKYPIMAAGLVGIPVAWLAGRATNVWQLSVLTALLWFNGGLGFAMISILTGLTVHENERGKAFGMLSLTSGLGAVIGGLASGAIVDRWDFGTLFTAISVFLILWPVSGALLVDAKTPKADRKGETARVKAALGKNFHLLFWASLVGAVAGFVVLLGRTLLMDSMDFRATAIAMTGAISGLVAMPLPLLIGWLSDRTGRKGYLYACYLAAIVSLVILAVSTRLWQFAIAMVLHAVVTGVSSTINHALLTDLMPQASLGRALSLFGSTGWIGAVVGFAGAGYALQHFGTLPTLAIAMLLPLFAIGLIIPVRAR